MLKLSIHRKDEDPLSELHIDIREEPQNFGSRDLADLLTELVTTLCDQILPKSLHHLDAFCGFRQLPFGWGQHTLEASHNQIPHDKGSDLIGPSPKKLLLKLDNRVAYRVFHTFFPVDYSVA